ncbi:MAG: transcriptional regulator with XRE-family HTH domain [Clostridium sp.]
MIGTRIKYYRKKTNITLSELSQRTALSVGCLSNLERGITSPTFDNMLKICEAMAINIVDLINESVLTPVVKKNERKLVYSKDYRLKYEYISDINQKLVGKCQNLYKEHTGEECCWGHETDEFGIIIKGSMVLKAYGESYVLEEGDSIYIKAFTKHVIKRLSNEGCISYWVSINGNSSRENYTDCQELK